MPIRIRLAAILGLLLSAQAHAQVPPHDRRCDKQPYGATAEELSAAQTEFQGIAAAMHADILIQDGSAKSVNWYLKNAVTMGLQKACYAKFDASALAMEDFHKAGVDDAQLQSLSTVTIAIRYFHHMGYPPDAQTNVLCALQGSVVHPVWGSREECDQLVTAEKQRHADELARAQQEEAARQARIANDPRCKSPPFGDTPKAYAQTQAALRSAAHGNRTDLDVLKSSRHDAMIQACQTKFDEASRLPYLQLGITEADIERLSVTELATTYLDAKQREIGRQLAAEQEDPNTIWAIFQCVQVTGECQIQQMVHQEPGTYRTTIYFASIAKCQDYMRHTLGWPVDRQTGRSNMGGSVLWYECLNHHVDNWERPQ